MELKKRILTGVLGSLVLFSLLIKGPAQMLPLFTLILSGFCFYELSSLKKPLGGKKQFLFILLGQSVLLLDAFDIYSTHQSFSYVLIGVAIFYLIDAKSIDRQERNPRALKDHFDEFILIIFAFCYSVLWPSHFLNLNRLTHGNLLVVSHLVIVFVADTAAYFVGVRWGSHKLYPLISPNKSWEGSLGGLLGSLVSAGILQQINWLPVSFWGAIVIGLMIGIFAQLGDFCESFFKRACLKKDSGGILPGHGGFLDRFDGVILSAPIMDLLLHWVIIKNS